MSNTNRVTLTQLDKMTAKEAEAIPTDQLAMLLDDVAEQKAKIARQDGKLQAELNRRLGEPARLKRQAEKKDTGTVRFDFDGFTVKADLPKKVEWDQSKFAAPMATLREWDENPADYVDIKFSVSEKKFDAWSPRFKALFSPARTLGAGKQTFSFVSTEAA